jgi:hypothetical protein
MERRENFYMSDMNVGDEIIIQCDVRPGPFSEERMITFDTVDGTVSGFVRERDLRKVDSQWYVTAVILKIENNILHVRAKGSFFTTNGLAAVQRQYAMAA